ncbi:hypothetical protein C8C96_1840 [Acidovorax sp. 100]|uniref:hypothetical protein n=1 Tax=Acidovorax sp. 100 TaxID=2135635 RepID=UPI000F177421|nr:hypothetical protein [Acidovorax sp. 100]RMA60817.1 hypothetical protein C8C96_1840 [Acidovorax sp. 100]
MAKRRKTLCVQRTLLTYDAPLVIYAEDSKAQPYVGVNYGDGEHAYLFYFVRVRAIDLELLYQQRIDVRYLVTRLRLGSPLFSECWANIGEEATASPEDEIAEEFLPDSGMFIPQQSINSLAIRTVSIDGRWDIEDMRRFSDLVQDSYAFVYALAGKGPASTKQKMGALFRRYPWRGGFSAVNFFDDLYKLIPANDRTEIKSIKYASPGDIQLRMDGDVATLIRSFVDDLNSPESVAQDAYKEARAFLRVKGWLGKAKDDLDLLAQDETRLMDFVQRLSVAFGLGGHVQDIVAFSNSDPLGAVKILLAYFRRLSNLADYSATGKAQRLFE